jgi:hypothetical protein
MGMGYNELYDLTPRTFNNKLIGFNSYQERIMQDNWEQTRLIIHSTLSPHIKKRISPKEVLPFPWDDKRKRKPKIASREHIEAVIEKYKNKKLNKI